MADLKKNVTSEGSTSSASAFFEPPVPTRLKTRNAYCDGGEFVGHPGVFLHCAPAGTVKCPYCHTVFHCPCIPENQHVQRDFKTGVLI